MPRLTARVLRVFTDERGRYGNPLAVVPDAAGLPGELGPRLTAALGFSETVFVDDAERAAVRIFNPSGEMRLAGHPVVGTAWLLARETGRVPEVLRPRLAAEVATWQEAGLTWVRGSCADAPRWEFVELADPAAVTGRPLPGVGELEHHQVWAWQDEAAGRLRARCFAAAIGIAEDEATGSAAMLQARAHGRALTIRQGRGSVLAARPAGDAEGWAEVGGRVAEDAPRTVDV